MAIKSTLSAIESEARRIAAKRNMLLMGAEVTVIFILPVIENILITNIKELGAQGIFTALIVPILAIHLILGLIVLMPTKNEFFFFEFLDLKKKYDELTSSHNRAQATGTVVYLALRTLRDFISVANSKDSSTSLDDIKTYFAKLLRTAVLNRDGVLGFSLRDRYSFTVYRYSEPEGLLKPFYCDKDVRVAPDDRAWPTNRGPLSFCFENQKCEFIPDLGESRYEAFFSAPNDKKSYRSLALVPVFDVNTREQKKATLGVLMVTSSEPGRFDADVHQSIFESLADILALFFVFSDATLPPGSRYV